MLVVVVVAVLVLLVEVQVVMGLELTKVVVEMVHHQALQQQLEQLILVVEVVEVVDITLEQHILMALLVVQALLSCQF